MSQADIAGVDLGSFLQHKVYSSQFPSLTAEQQRRIESKYGGARVGEQRQPVR